MNSRNRWRLGRILASALGLMLVIAVMAPGLAQGGIARARGHNVRWDLLLLQPPGSPTTALAGGTNIGRDEATGDTVELTGSGGAIPALRDATGGGTFVHKHENGEEVAHGFYLVTGFVSWQRRTGTFPLPNDGIGHASQASAGLLSLNVRFFPSDGPPVDGVLTVHCHFPDTPGPNDEGISLVIGPFNFVQAGGVTVFHVFR
ncbi:MAG TPA: hypothetical protein VGL18_14685 [Actinomycetota bacterium]